MLISRTITRKCRYWESCKYCDSIECIDNICGCQQYHNKEEEAENPLKSRRNN